jgi:hypothetical protein
VRIELTYKGFADLSLTTWVPRPLTSTWNRKCNFSSYITKIIKVEFSLWRPMFPRGNAHLTVARKLRFEPVFRAGYGFEQVRKKWMPVRTPDCQRILSVQYVTDRTANLPRE